MIEPHTVGDVTLRAVALGYTRNIVQCNRSDFEAGDELVAPRGSTGILDAPIWSASTSFAGVLPAYSPVDMGVVCRSTLKSRSVQLRARTNADSERYCNR